MSEEKSNSASIECRPNGPYLVKGLPRLFNSKGEEIPAKPVYALCRCGQSANKPFCDGTHARIGFSGEREREGTTPAPDSYAGKEGTLQDNRNVCAHVGHCTDALPGVFRLRQEPWIDPDGADAQALENAVRNCPSGALAWAATGQAGGDPAETPSITVLKNGPYAVAGGPEPIDEATGQKPYHQARYALCRCGQSKNKPFCDGSHWKAEFQDEKN